MLIETLAIAAGLGGLLSLASPVRSIETVIDIPAPPHAVWQVLTDGPAYAQWNPFIRSMSGTVTAGTLEAARKVIVALKAWKARPRRAA